MSQREDSQPGWILSCCIRLVSEPTEALCCTEDLNSGARWRDNPPGEGPIGSGLDAFERAEVVNLKSVAEPDGTRPETESVERPAFLRGERAKLRGWDRPAEAHLDKLGEGLGGGWISEVLQTVKEDGSKWPQLRSTVSGMRFRPQLARIGGKGVGKIL
jgi:hypothetical protein